MNLKTTLKDEIEASGSLEDFGWRLANFLDAFYADPNVALIQEEPPFVKDRFARGEIVDAYAAATAESLAHRFSMPVPEWADAQSRISEEPFFTMHSPAGRAFVLAYTPPEFKARHLFVGLEPLSRV